MLNKKNIFWFLYFLTIMKSNFIFLIFTIMKMAVNPVISLSKKWTKSLVKVMTWELKTSISKAKIKKIFLEWLSLRKNTKI